MSSTGSSYAEIFYRVFPTKNIQWDLMKISNSTVYVKKLQDLSKAQHQSKFYQFPSHGVFFNDSQEYVYSTVIEGLLDRICQGYNGVIIAYGQTGTGKSFTVGGLTHTEKEFGIAPRVVFDLFKLKNELPENKKMCIQMSYAEFAAPFAFDLFKDFPNSVDLWHVKNITKIKVKSEYEALKLLYEGEGRKSFSSNGAYMSHIGTSVLTFYITTVNQDFTNPEKISSKLHIIDMAGIDSVGSVSSNFKKPFDVGKANITKSYLENFVLYLLENNSGQTRLQERTNPLIYFLGDDLCSSLLRFIGHIRIQKEDMKITLSVLRFGHIVKNVKIKVKEVEPDINEELKLQHLQHKLEQLQREKIYQSVLMNQNLTTNLSQQRIDHMYVMINEYLKNNISELGVLNVSEASEAFKVLKSICNQLEEEKRLQPDPMSESKSHNKRVSKIGSARMSIKSVKSAKRLKKFKEEFDGPDTKQQQQPQQPQQQQPQQQHHQQHQQQTSEMHSQSPNKAVIITNAHRLSSSNKLGTTPSGTQLHGKSNKVRPPSVTKHSSFSNVKKSNSSSIKERRTSKNHLQDLAMLPDILPGHRPAWIAFTADSKSSFKTFSDLYKTNEMELKNAYGSYSKGLDRFEECKDLVQKRKNELIEAKMFQQYASIEDYHSNEVIANTIRICEDNLTSAQAKLLLQQEAVLKLQSDIKICLNNRVEIKQHLRADFQHYCKENYGIVIADVHEEQDSILVRKDEETELSFPDYKDKEEEYSGTELIIDDTVKIDKLKCIMKKVLNKNVGLRRIKNRKWENPSLKR
ncbi:hypothetical protein NQ315_000510 [Exocentrus adspersus]|uniref:Kinesin motor domain-containing protein n=1 Tax=Exocentrus adspersus TaxID=1586481 RepID=A0AAV8V9T7_9CUCU|nr:hypothetical protein NQ315_000510 [Exocentrus adspersus]